MRRAMPDRKASSKRNSSRGGETSRTAAKIGVAVLIVIAVAGVVLTGLRSRNSAADPDGTPESGAPLTGSAASSASAGDDGGGPSAVIFPPGSSRLSAGAVAKLQQLAETARKDHRTVVISTRIERSGAAEQMDLARKRTIAVRQVFETNGIALRAMQMEIAQSPPGAIAPSTIHRVEIALR